MDKRTRKSRFSGREISELLQQISENAAIINNKMSNSLIRQRKKDVWTFIQSAVNSVESTSPDRTVDEVKKKWNDLKGAVMRYKSDVNGAGGERSHNFPPFYDVILDILADKKVSLNGRTDNDLAPSPAAGWDEEMKTIQMAASTHPSSSVQGTVNQINVISIDPFSSNPSVKRSATPTSTVLSDEVTPEQTLSHHSFPASPPSNTEAMAANHARINKLSKKRKKLRRPCEDELWKKYLTEEIKVKKLQLSKLEEEIKTQRVMREYYKKKLEKLS